MKMKNNLAYFSYNLMRNIADPLSERLKYYEKLVYSKSGIPIYFKVYVSEMLFISITVFITTFIISLPIHFIIYKYYAIPLSLILASTALGITIAIMYYYPIYKMNSDSRTINSKFLETSTLMTAITASGTTIDKTIETATRITTIKPLRTLFLRFLRNRFILGMDTVSALKEIRDAAPSIRFSLFLDGLSSVTLTSSDIHSYLLNETIRLLEEKRDRLKRLTSSLGIIGELYVSLMVVFPSILIIMLSLILMLGGTIAGIPPLLLITILLFIAIPLGAIAIITITDSMLSEV
ncbi:MAG: type II secretion system F family protein [Thermoprotei archaeon]